MFIFNAFFPFRYDERNAKHVFELVTDKNNFQEQLECNLCLRQCLLSLKSIPYIKA